MGLKFPKKSLGSGVNGQSLSSGLLTKKVAGRTFFCLSFTPFLSLIFQQTRVILLKNPVKNRNYNKRKLENVFVKHYAPNHMPDSKGEWSLKENNSETSLRNMFQS